MAKTNKLKDTVTYELPEDATVCISCRGKADIFITDDETGVWVKAYPADGGSETPVADTYLTYDDPLLKSSDDIDGERDNEAAVAGSD